MSTVSAEYLEFNKNCDEIFFQSVTSESRSLHDFHYYLELLQNLDRFYFGIEADRLMKEVSMDLIVSHYLASIGIYRTAYATLRGAIELSMQYIYFVDNNFDYLMWKKNKKDIAWSSLFGKDGYFLYSFTSIFGKKSCYEAFNSNIFENICETYKLCSEYTHGKFEFTALEKTDAKIKFDKTEIQKFMEVHQTALKIIISIQVIRYRQVIISKQNEEDILDLLNELLKDFDLKEIIYE